MLSATAKTKINKGAHKACLDTQQLHNIIDESLLAHIAIVDKGEPVVIPMLAWRVDEHVYVHGARNSRLMKSLAAGQKTCLTFTLFDGWVLARSAFHHSAHYRSAVVFGQFTGIEEDAEKDRLLNHFIEQIAPGRLKDVRPSNAKELAATVLLQLPLTEASVKIGNKGVNDDSADMDIKAWAGVMPYRTVIGPLEDDPELAGDIVVPDYASAYGERWYTQK